MLKVSELGDLETVEHDLPTDAPGAEGGRFPVVLFELDIVLAEINTDGFEAAEILFEDVIGRGLQDDLELLVFVETVGVFAIAAIGRAAAGLDVGNLIRFGPENAEEGFGGHGAGAYLEVMRLLDDGATVGPVVLQFEDGVLKRVHVTFAADLTLGFESEISSRAMAVSDRN